MSNRSISIILAGATAAVYILVDCKRFLKTFSAMAALDGTYSIPITLFTPGILAAMCSKAFPAPAPTSKILNLGSVSNDAASLPNNFEIFTDTISIAGSVSSP